MGKVVAGVEKRTSLQSSVQSLQSLQGLLRRKKKTRKPVHTRQEDDSSSEEYLLTVSAESLDNVDSQKLYAKRVVNGHDIQFHLDSGAAVNVLPAREYKKVCDDPELKELKASEAILSMYNGTEICPLGKRRISLRNPKNNRKYNLKEKYQEEPERLVERGIIAKVSEPTDWISSTVVVMKPNGKMRLCLDPRPSNKALKRNHYPMPIIDDLLPDLGKARIFSVVDVQLDNLCHSVGAFPVAENTLWYCTCYRVPAQT